MCPIFISLLYTNRSFFDETDAEQKQKQTVSQHSIPNIFIFHPV